MPAAGVALLTESVDRNCFRVALESGAELSLSSRRAWIEMLQCNSAAISALSLSSRRAWIEISRRWNGFATTRVALLTESVDRNFTCQSGIKNIPRSLSSRRAWIEITSVFSRRKISPVALLTESVDRNKMTILPCRLSCSRSPHGERG